MYVVIQMRFNAVSRHSAEMQRYRVDLMLELLIVDTVLIIYVTLAEECPVS
jgi:hypothetical protein